MLHKTIVSYMGSLNLKRENKYLLNFWGFGWVCKYLVLCRQRDSKFFLFQNFPLFSGQPSRFVWANLGVVRKGSFFTNSVIWLKYLGCKWIWSSPRTPRPLPPKIQPPCLGATKLPLKNEWKWMRARKNREWMGPKNSGFLGSPKKGWFYLTSTSLLCRTI